MYYKMILLHCYQDGSHPHRHGYLHLIILITRISICIDSMVCHCNMYVYKHYQQFKIGLCVQYYMGTF